MAVRRPRRRRSCHDLLRTERTLPILNVSHEFDEEDGPSWQFHCGNDDYRPAVLKLVRLDELLEIDASILELAALPIGFSASRVAHGTAWILSREEQG